MRSKFERTGGSAEPPRAAAEERTAAEKQRGRAADERHQAPRCPIVGALAPRFLSPSAALGSRGGRAAALAVLVVLVALAVQAADPFYLRLLREGTDSYNRRDYAAAERQLRVACFGLLDEPELLADGLVRLGLAQAAAGNTAGFAETFQRLAEVEERFGGFTAAAIPPDVRDSFLQLVVKLIPHTTIAERPAIARLIPAPTPRGANPPRPSPAAKATVTPTVAATPPPTPRIEPAPTRAAPSVPTRAQMPMAPTPGPSATPFRLATLTPRPTPGTASPTPTVLPTASTIPSTAGGLTRPPLFATPSAAERKPPAAQRPTADEQRELDAIQEMLSKKQLVGALQRARKLADQAPDLAEAQFAAGELAYRLGRFPEAAAFFRRGGDPGDGRPLLLFYEAVSFYETGELEKAAACLKRALPRIKRTGYVESYVQKIQARKGDSPPRP